MNLQALLNISLVASIWSAVFPWEMPKTFFARPVRSWVGVCSVFPTVRRTSGPTGLGDRLASSGAILTLRKFRFELHIRLAREVSSQALATNRIRGQH